MTDINPQEFGRLQAEAAMMKELLADIRTELRAITENNAELNRKFDETKGGAKVLLGVSAVFGALFMKMLDWLMVKL